jgi:hypothetical protein
MLMEDRRNKGSGQKGRKRKKEKKGSKGEQEGKG